MNVRDVERIVDRKLAPFKALVELLDSVEHLDDFAIQGTGIAGQEVRADLAGQYGVYSRAPKDGDAVIIKLGGKGASAICLGFRFRGKEVQLVTGEVMARDDQDQLLYLQRDGVQVAGKKVTIQEGTNDQRAARKGDPIKCGWLLFSPNVPPAGAASLTYLPLGTIPTPTPLLYPAPLVLIELVGVIDKGSGEVFIGGDPT